VRGLHFQQSPHEEVKLVRCIRGSIYDVLVDLRDDSPTYGRSFGAELSEANGLSLYVPSGFAHGYQALTDGATVHYLVSAFYAPDYEDGIHHADPSLGIKWPLPITAVSTRDAQLRFLSRKT
jgi:dTDP-4-dehydrorhamnose 3,5-epimerase